LRDRLDDIDDLLLRDDSPREAWSGITEERVMRRAVSHELRTLANHVYTVDQEAATADEKETDRGSKNRLPADIRRLVGRHAIKITQAVLTKARAGDARAAAILLKLVVPPMRDRPPPVVSTFSLRYIKLSRRPLIASAIGTHGDGSPLSAKLRQGKMCRRLAMI
jgi:hypothetical protein